MLPAALRTGEFQGARRTPSLRAWGLAHTTGMRRLLLASVGLLFVLLATAGLRADEGDDAASGVPASYIRLDDQGDHLALEVASREFVRADGKGPTVWLVGAIHIADPVFYQRVQEVLDGLDLVLYESVMPAGAGRLRTATAEERVADTRERLAFLAGVVRLLMRDDGDVPADRAALTAAVAQVGARLADVVAGAWTDAWGRNIRYRRLDAGEGKGPYLFVSYGADGKPDGEGENADLEAGLAEGTPFYENVVESTWNMQKELAEALDLSWQGDGIDYDRENFTPSDMSLDELDRAIQARGGDRTFLDRALAGGGLSGLMARVMVGMLKLAGWLSGGRLTVVMKMVMVTVLADPAVAQGHVQGVDDATMGAVLFDRNAVALRDLDGCVAALAGREPPPSIGIFYGAAHMPDMEKHLRERGWVPRKTRWFPGISVDLSKTGMSRESLDGMRAGIQRSIEERMRKDRAEGAEK